jgi:DNA-directed RNA polymerase subunit RPC12/RpoP
MKDEGSQPRKKNNQRKRRFFGNGTWYCMACGAKYTSLEVKALSIITEYGCPECGGVFEYMED